MRAEERAALVVGSRTPSRFFGIVPQSALTPTDIALMRSARIGSLRTPVNWSVVQPTPGKIDWHGLDGAVSLAAREGLEVLPYFYGTPSWISPQSTSLPVADGGQQAAWSAFLQAAVRRYGPGGSFWAEHGPGTAEPLPSVPIRRWQVWNEPNFFYFTMPASPKLYAQLLKVSARAIRAVDARAQILIGGLFGHPRERSPKAMPAASFLQRLYRFRGIKHFFDGIALHPYAANINALRRAVWRVRRVALANHDQRTGLYITEIGWGSQPNAHKVAFEVGKKGQARELRKVYGHLLLKRRELNLKGIYWFSWKDATEEEGGESVCDFCDSAGLFQASEDESLEAKPAWHALVKLTGGKVELQAPDAPDVPARPDAPGVLPVSR